MNFFARAWFFLGLVLFTPATLHAQSAVTWESTDYASPVAEMWVTNSGTVFVKAAPAEPLTAAPLGAVSRSDDGGATWSHVPVPADLALEAVDLTNSTTMFATRKNAVYRSLDAGATWTQVFPEAAGSGPVKRIHISDSDHDLIYSEADAPYRSRDGGLTWTKLSPPVVENLSCIPELASLQPDAADPQRLFYAADCRGPHGFYAGIVARSDDQGSTWTTLAKFAPLRGGGASGTFKTFVKSFATGALDAADRIYAVGVSEFLVTLARSDDGGLTWTSLQSWRGYANGSAVVVDPANADHLYATFGIDSGADPPRGGSPEMVGVNESWDGGASWNGVGQPDLPGVTRLALAADRTRLYGGTRKGVYILSIVPPDGDGE